MSKPENEEQTPNPQVTENVNTQNEAPSNHPPVVTEAVNNSDVSVVAEPIQNTVQEKEELSVESTPNSKDQKEEKGTEVEVEEPAVETPAKKEKDFEGPSMGDTIARWEREEEEQRAAEGRRKDRALENEKEEARARDLENEKGQEEVIPENTTNSDLEMEDSEIEGEEQGEEPDLSEEEEMDGEEQEGEEQEGEEQEQEAASPKKKGSKHKTIAAKSEEKEPDVIDAFFEMIKSVFRMVNAVLKGITKLITGREFNGSPLDDDQDLENDQRTPEEKEVQKKRQKNVEKGVGSAIDSVLGAVGMVANQEKVEEEKVNEGEEVEPNEIEEQNDELEEEQEVEMVNTKDKEQKQEKQNDVPITSLNDVVVGSKKSEEPQKDGKSDEVEAANPDQENARKIAKIVADLLKKNGIETMSDHEDSNVKASSIAKSTQKVEEQQKEGAER